jgi:pimeloyl-ACP methyl ester carboxylesterase
VLPTPFRIEVEQSILDDLSLRLAEARFTSVGSGSDWDSGTDPSYLRELVGYWRSDFDWRKEEDRLNALPQFCANVSGNSLHFVHVRGRGPKPTPLLLLHGFPDSFDRYHKLIPILTDPASVGGDPEDAFDVVVPSLPGFAFTGAVAYPPGVRSLRYAAELLFQLMSGVLGYERFAVAGGDGGSVLAQILGIDRPRAVSAIHLTDLGWHALNVDPRALPKQDRQYLEHAQQRFLSDGAYAVIQATSPRSLAPALNDSPVGLASWILDRFHSWSDGDLERAFGRDVLLTNVMLYWVTQTIGSAIHGYYSERRMPSLAPGERVERPVGLALFPNEVAGVPPRSFAERTLNVERYREMPRGGHFAALEVPGLYARELFEFFRSHRASTDKSEGKVDHVRPSL